MKLLILLIISLISLVYSQTSFVYITPQDYYYDKCNSGTNYGVGYVLPLSYCYSLGSRYVKLELHNSNITASWSSSCSSPPNVTYSYEINSCSQFNVPNEESFLSTISLTGDIPTNSIVFSYYFQSNKNCGNLSYIKYYTNHFSERVSYGVENEYFCNNGVPTIDTCDKESGSCDSIAFNGCENADSTHPYPYSVSCSNL